jgi:hypothetical protein
MIFGREPALFYTLVANIITLASGLGLNLSVEQQGVLNAMVVLLSGCVLAWKVATEQGIALLGGVAKGLIALALAFGAHLSPELQSSALLVVNLAIAFIVRSQVTAPTPPRLPAGRDEAAEVTP